MIHDPVATPDSRRLIAATGRYVDGRNWEALVDGGASKPSGCGAIFELGDRLGEPNTDVCIADQRALRISEPHYHPAPDLEYYLILEGAMRLHVGSQVVELHAGDGYLIPPETVHYSEPNEQCVLAAANLPAFQPDRYIVVSHDDPARGYDHAGYSRLAKERGTMTK